MSYVLYTIPRIRFQRVGYDDTLDWSTVKALKIVIRAVAGSTGAFGFDKFVVKAGADGKAFNGNYRACMKFVFQDTTFTDESLPSPVSSVVSLSGEAMKFVIPQATAIAMDPQTTAVWPYIWSEQMGGFFRTVNPLSMNRSKKSLTEWGAFPADGAISADDRMRILTVGRRYGRRYTPGTDPVYTVNTSTASGPVSYTTTTDPSSIGGAGGATYSGTVVPLNLVWDMTSDTFFTMNFVYSSVPTDATITSVSVAGVIKGSQDFPAVPTINASVYVTISGVTYSTAFTFDADGATHGFSNTWTTDPSTGAAWTAASRNAARFGVSANSDTRSYTTTLTQLTVTDVYTTPGSASTAALSKNVLTFRIQSSDSELLLRNDSLLVGRDAPPDNVIGMVGNYFTRTLCLCKDYLHISDPNRSTLYPVFQKLKISDGTNNKNLWIFKASGSVYIGTTLDIYRLDGDLVEQPNGTLNARLTALNTGSPPVNSTVAFEGNALVYMAADGPRALVGENSTALKGPLDLLLKNENRYGVPKIDVTDGRHRLAMSRGFLYWALPSQSTASLRKSVAEFIPGTADKLLDASDRRRVLTVGRGRVGNSSLLRHEFTSGKWTYRPYPFTVLGVARDLNGDIIAGNDRGQTLKLDRGTQDNTTAVPMVLWTSQQDGGKPLRRKFPFDLSIRVDTGGSDVTCAVHLDGSETAATSFTVNTSGQQVFMRDMSALSIFRRVQLRWSGSPNDFKLWDWNFSYRDAPQHHYYVDTGNVVTGFEYIHWFREVTILARSDNDLYVDLYFDDVLSETKTVTVTAGVTKTYRIPLGREEKGRQPRAVVRTSASAAATEEGFELYYVRWKVAPSGNETQKPVVTWSAVKA